MSRIDRYRRVPLIAGGRKIGTSRVCYAIRRAIQLNRISYREHVLKEGERLDVLAGKFLGSAELWWVIAAASGIGWALQSPPGTLVKIPTHIGQIEALVG
tara:strand:- start:519 stop:818 length:300 start_codon:yes stop_codon:yes gene_type:complete